MATTTTTTTTTNTTTTTATTLVLPPAPSPSLSVSSAIEFWAPSIAATYQRLPIGFPSLLYIGVFPPFSTCSRRASFDAAQRLLTALYSLAYFHFSAQPVDVRIVLLSDHDAVFGPTMSVEQLAELQEWDQLLVPKNDLGYQLQGQFLAATGSPSMRVNYVKGGRLTGDGDEELGEGEGEDGDGDNEEQVGEDGGQEHYAVAVGGTFDHLHFGHKLLLTCTAYLGAPETPTTRIVIGLTGPEMLKNKKHAEQMEPWKIRAERTIEFIRGIVDVTPFDCRKPVSLSEHEGIIVATICEWRDGEDIKTLRVELSELTDPFGPASTDKSITALVVTKETEGGGEAVNTKRKEKGWDSLEMGVVDLLMDGGEKVSSTELRKRARESAITF